MALSAIQLNSVRGNTTGLECSESGPDVPQVSTVAREDHVQQDSNLRPTAWKALESGHRSTSSDCVIIPPVDQRDKGDKDSFTELIVALEWLMTVHLHEEHDEYDDNYVRRHAGRRKLSGN